MESDQDMGKHKNVETEHYLADVPKDDEEPDFMPLARGVLSVGSEGDENVEEFAYYDGDGTPESDVVSVKKNHPVEGHFYNDEPSHLFIREKEFETGDGRKCIYKQVRSTGETLIGTATLLDIDTTGGPAEEYAPLACTISWDKKPEITSKDDDSGGVSSPVIGNVKPTNDGAAINLE